MKYCHLYAQYPDGMLMELGAFPCEVSCASVDYLRDIYPNHPWHYFHFDEWRMSVVFEDGFDPGYDLYVIRS